MGALVLHVRLHDGRYHGEGDWPPSPARLFQALVAGAGIGGPIQAADEDALRWLEKQAPPVIAAPPAWRSHQGVRVFVPNNDSDRIGGDPQRMSSIRTATKTFRPYFFDGDLPFVYVWLLALAARDDGAALSICSLADRLYQFGRGIDMAWAWSRVLDEGELGELLGGHVGPIFRPSSGSSRITLPSPCVGSLESLERRYRAFGERFRYLKDERSVRVLFRQPPRPRFRPVAYDSPPQRLLFDLRSEVDQWAFSPWPLSRATKLVVCLRDGAVAKLAAALPERRAEIERLLAGHRPDGSHTSTTEQRVRIVPLPSIGHQQADRVIRRVLVEVPADCPLSADDIEWAFSGLQPLDASTGEVHCVILTPTDGAGMHRHYGVGDEPGATTWRTVTPAALPATRRRIEPTRRSIEAKAGSERYREEALASGAVVQALRHAGIREAAETVRVQREPFDCGGERAEASALDTRFNKHQLWHVEITFLAPVRGPVVIGDGRFLGLGLMAPVKATPGVFAFHITGGLQGAPAPEGVASALRRAVMARVQNEIGRGQPLPTLLTGHRPDGRPDRQHQHLAFGFDASTSVLFVLAPHVLHRRCATRGEHEDLRVLDAALSAFRELRAGDAGVLALGPCHPARALPHLLGRGKVWHSVTEYEVTRHAKGGTATEAIAIDVRNECGRAGLPQPVVTVQHWRGVSNHGLVGRVRLDFAVSVPGPIALGRTRYRGGGLFAAAGMERQRRGC